MRQEVRTKKARQAAKEYRVWFLPSTPEIRVLEDK
jgi:hypothetical protein